MHTLSVICSTILSFGIKKSIPRITKLRISAHDLLIERGRYFRPKIPREQRLCTTCNKVEDEEHFLLFCTKYSTLRSTTFQRLCVDSHDLHPQSCNAFELLMRLLNPKDIEETLIICNFITSALLLR